MSSLDSLPTSEDGVEGGSYETLEEWIFKSERDQEQETRISVRPETWQITYVDLISTEMGTNKSEVYNRVFSAGLMVIRDRIGWERLKNVHDMRNSILKLIIGHKFDDNVILSIQREMQRNQFEINSFPQGSIGEPANIPVKKSVVSEIQEHFADRSHMKASELYRVIIGCGIGESKNYTEGGEGYVSDMVISVDEAISKTRSMFQRLFIRFVSMADSLNYNYSEGFIEDLEDFYKLMDEDKQKYVEGILSRMEDELDGQ